MPYPGGLCRSQIDRLSDAIADKTGLGGNWIGFLLIGIVTSVPELASGISAATLADVPDLAVGAIFGACIFNLAIIVILDLFYRKDSIYHSASQSGTHSFRLLRDSADRF